MNTSTTSQHKPIAPASAIIVSRLLAMHQSCAWLASAAEIPLPTLTRRLAARSTFTIDELDAIAHALDVGLADLVGTPSSLDAQTLDETPTLNHYVRKDRITRSIVEGVAVRAVCGARFVVESQGGGRIDAPDAIVCPDCQALYDQMKAE